jgi:hypothetical protein
MFRPVTITHPVVVNDGKPFEAIDLNSEAFDTILSDDHYFMYFLNEKIGVVDTYYDASVAYRNIIWQLSQALNPPIKVTQAVLEAMGKVPEAKYRIRLGRFTQSLSKANSSKGICFYHYKIYTDLDNVDIFEEESHKKLLLKVGNYIQADCPLALQVLLGFTTEGVLKDA